MGHKNFEVKARVDSVLPYEIKLRELNPRFAGEDYQTDTYFNVSTCRLKLREGNIENALIDYEREDIPDSKLSKIHLFKFSPNDELKIILTKHLQVRVTVKKRRRIYFIDNVKFHFDIVEHLGSFVEIEAIDEKGILLVEELRTQCNYYFDYLRLEKMMVEARSYSDMLENI